MIKTIRYVIIGILVLLLLLSIGIYAFLSSSFVSELSYENEKISIKRGDYNIPEIHAPSFKSAFYAWGYVTAQDRLFQISFRRAAVRGELAQYLGEKAIDIDKMFREINLNGWAKRIAQKFIKENVTEYNNFKAYADGINAYYKSLMFRPLQFYMLGMHWQQWTVTDIYAFYKLLKWTLSSGAAEEYFRSSLLKNYTKQQINQFFSNQPKDWINDIHGQQTIIKDDQIPEELKKKGRNANYFNFKPMIVDQMLKIGYYQFLDLGQRASNNWVISGNLTESGHPLICNDPHLDSSLPGQWHQIRIYYKGSKGQQYYMIGGANVGLPLMLGKTTYVAITATTNYIDSQDLFKQKIQNQKYFVNGSWYPLKIRTQKIKVKGKQTIQYNVSQTFRGPIIKHVSFKGNLYKIQQDISLAWPGFTDVDYLALVQYTHIAQYTNFNHLDQLLKVRIDYSPYFNFIYATKDDKIGYFMGGFIPKRKNREIGKFIKDGTTTQHDWLGLVQSQELLHVENPKRGYIVSANNKAASQNYFGGALDFTVYTARANRIQQLIQNQIKSGRKLNKQFMKKIQLDTVDNYCLTLINHMKQVVEVDPDYNFVFSTLKYFDCNFSSTSTTASFYMTFLQNVYEQIHPQGQNRTWNLFTFLNYHQHIYRFIMKEHTQEQKKMLNTSMFDALKQLRTYFESDNPSTYHYGKLHRDLMIHRPFSYSQKIKRFFEHESQGLGNFNTPNVGIMHKFHDKDYRTNHRANIRLIMSFYQDSQWIIDGGTSQKFYSSHYKDQNQLFMQGKYITMHALHKGQGSRQQL